MLKSNGEITISFSELSTFIKCPYKHYLEYECGKKEEEQKNEFSCFGDAVHVGIESLYEHSDVMIAQNEFSERIQLLWKEHNLNDLKEFETLGLIAIAEMFQQGIVQREEFQKKELELLVPLRDNIFFKGFVDVITYDPEQKKIIITDIKTTKKGWSEYKKEEFVTRLQLYLYQWFLSKIYECDPNLFVSRFLFVKYNFEEIIEEWYLENKDSEWKKTEELLNSVINALYYGIGNRKLKFKNKNSCRFCQFESNNEECSSQEQHGFMVIGEHQLSTVFERSTPDERLLVIPWRDINYENKAVPSDWKDKILNQIHKREQQDDNAEKTQNTKKQSFNIYQEQKR